MSLLPTNTSVKIIAVDDNTASLRTIENYAHRVPWLELIDTFESPIAALDFLSKQSVDMILIDVQMDEISGLDFITIAKKRIGLSLPIFIIISSYAQYAIDGFELDITDYLLKPFRFERFLAAIEKGRARQLLNKSSVSDTSDIFIRHANKSTRLELSQIQYIQSYQHFVKLFFLNDTPLVLNQSMGHMVDTLKSHGFLQIHKQFIVNIQYISEITNNQVRIKNSDALLPVGRKYKPMLTSLTYL